MAAIDCVAQGLGEESATKALAEAAFNSMEDAALTRSFLGLSVEAQLKIIGTMKSEFGDIPAPWEIEKFGGKYQPGSYTGGGFSVSPLSKADKVIPVDVLIGRATEDEWREDIKSARIDERTGEGGGFTGTIDQPDSNQGVFGMDYTDGEFNFNQGRVSQGSGGSYGAALGAVQKEAVDALRSSMLKSLGADELLEAMNSLPGAPIVAQMLKRMPCRQTPIIYMEPRLDSFMNTLEFDFCAWDFDLTFPDLMGGLDGIIDLFLLLLEAIEEAIIDTAIAILMQIIKLILEKLFSIACDALATLGANLLDLFGGNNHFRNLLKDNLCPDATQEDMNDALKNLFAAVGGPDATCLEELSGAVMGAFIDDLSLMLTQGQIIQLLQGNPTEETINLAIEVALTSPSECIREVFGSDPNAFLLFFSSLSPFIPNLDEIAESIGEADKDLPPNPCDEETLIKIEELKCDLLGAKGLSPEECRDQLDDLKDKAIQDLQDLANALQSGAFSSLPALEGTDDCPSDGFFPKENPLQKSLDANISRAMLESIEKQHLRDLWGPINTITGNGGFLNGVMSDTKGRPFKHHNWYVAHFGSPLAADLGFFEYHCDNAILKPDDTPGNNNVPIDMHGNQLKNEEGGKSAKQMFGVGPKGSAHGGYPPTIAAYLSKQYREMDNNLSFSTTTKPKGYPNMQAALDEHARVMRVNEKRIKERRKYVNKWLDTYGVRRKGQERTQSKRSVLEQDLLMGITKPLFYQKDWEDEDATKGFNAWRKIHKKNSPEDLAREVLLGKRVLGGVGKTGNSLEKDIGGRWGTEGKVFIDHYGPGKKHRLLELPDTSSADIVLKYEGYPEDPEEGTPSYEYTVEYDYNLVDAETNQLSAENKYQIKIVETHRSSKDKGLTKKEKRKLGNDLQPQSIYQTGTDTYIFPRYQFEVGATVDADILTLLDEISEPAINESRSPPPQWPSADPPEDAYEIEALYKYFSKILTDASFDPAEARRLVDRKPFRNYFAKQRPIIPTSPLLMRKATKGLPMSLFDEISSGFLTKMSTVIATGKSNKKNKSKDDDPGRGKQGKLTALADMDDISRGFKFGYDPEKEAKIIELDPMKYGGPLGRLFPDMVPPPFYVKERKQSGWMDICDTLVPEPSGCEPRSKAVYDLEDLNDHISSLQSDFIADQRLNSDPLCAQESPYDKIFTSFDAANLDAAMRATIRIYALDVFLRTIPVFVAFGFSEDNYDDLLLAFVAERIKDGLYEDGARRTGVTDDNYYYRFLEQAVNNTKRKLDAGIITEEDMSQEEIEAFSVISERVRDFYEEYDGELESLSDAAIRGKGMFDAFFSPTAGARAVGIGYGSSRFNKAAAKLAKDRAFTDMVLKTEKEATVFLRRYIREEFNTLRTKFADVIRPIVDNVDHLFVLDPNWIRGAVNDQGPYNVMSDPNEPTDYVIESADSEEYWPFVLEKYIRIHEKNVRPAELHLRKPNLKGVVNIDDWDAYVKGRKSSGMEGNISDFWGNPPPEGETTKIENHTHTYTVDEEGNGKTSLHVGEDGYEHFHEIKDGKLERSILSEDGDGHSHKIEITGWSFGLRICYQPQEKDNDVFKDIVNTIDEETVMDSKTYRVKNRNNKTRYLIPIASAELPIPDQKYDLFKPEGYDVVCLIQELIKTPEYRMMFKYIFPLPRFISLLAIYSTMGFTASIGNVGFPKDGGDLWEDPGGKPGKKFRKWNHSPNKAFDRSRQASRSVFENFYEAAQAIDFDTSSDRTPRNSADTLRSLIRPKINFEDGLRWWERGLRVKGNPYNVDGDECE